MVLLSTHFILNIFHDLCYIKILLISLQENFMSLSNDAIEKGGTGATTVEETYANLGLGSLAVQNKDAVEITNGAIDGTLIGSSAPAQGKFTTLEVNSELTVTSQVISFKKIELILRC
ncbi:hypothetical protein D3C87_595160 [compost metagenome]